MGPASSVATLPAAHGIPRPVDGSLPSAGLCIQTPPFYKHISHTELGPPHDLCNLIASVTTLFVSKVMATGTGSQVLHILRGYNSAHNNQPLGGHYVPTPHPVCQEVTLDQLKKFWSQDPFTVLKNHRRKRVVSVGHTY